LAEVTVEVKYNQGTLPPTGSFVGGGVFASFSAGKKKRRFGDAMIKPTNNSQEMDSTAFLFHKNFAHNAVSIERFGPLSYSIFSSPISSTNLATSRWRSKVR
jgi:hypothetical protein